jgi:hypothetical protein
MTVTQVLSFNLGTLQKEWQRCVASLQYHALWRLLLKYTKNSNESVLIERKMVTHLLLCNIILW